MSEVPAIATTVAILVSNRVIQCHWRVVSNNESCLRSLSMKKIELIKLKMELEKERKVSQSLEDISERCDKLYLEASLIQASIEGEEIKGQIENVVGAIELLYKTCLNLLTNANVGSSKSKFVKVISTPSPKNSENDVFGLYSNTVEPIPVRAHVPPKVLGLKLLKDSKIKDPDVVENPTVSGIGDKARQLDMDNCDPAMSSPQPLLLIHVDSSASGGNGVMIDAQENNTCDTQWPNVYAPVFTTDSGLRMQLPPGFQNALPITHNKPFMYPLAITPFNGDCLKYCEFTKNCDKYVASSVPDDGYRLLQLESLSSGEVKKILSGLGRIYDKAQVYCSARARLNSEFSDRHLLMNTVRKDLLKEKRLANGMVKLCPQ